MEATVAVIVVDEVEFAMGGAVADEVVVNSVVETVAGVVVLCILVVVSVEATFASIVAGNKVFGVV